MAVIGQGAPCLFGSLVAPELAGGSLTLALAVPQRDVRADVDRDLQQAVDHHGRVVILIGILDLTDRSSPDWTRGEPEPKPGRSPLGAGL